MNPNTEHNPVERKSQNHKCLSFVSFFSSLMLIFSFVFYLYTAFSNEEKLFAIDSFLGFTTEYTRAHETESAVMNTTTAEFALQNTTSGETIAEATGTEIANENVTLFTSTTDSLLAALRGSKINRKTVTPAPAPTPIPTPAATGNIAPSGTAYSWSKNSTATSNSNKVVAPLLNDNNLFVDHALNGGAGETTASYEAGGVIWTVAQTINSVDFINGTWLTSFDGGFSSGINLQFTTDASTWTNSGWGVAPAYAYNSPSVSGITYSFSGTPVSVLGVRVLGQAHTNTWSSYWVNMREIRAYGSSVVINPTPIPTPSPVIPAPVASPAPSPTPTPVPSPTPNPTPVALNTGFGISVGDTLPSLSDAELNKTLDDMVGLGMGWIRLDISWSDVQHYNSTDYDWQLIDRIVAQANTRNIKILAMIGYTPSWARLNGCGNGINCSPNDFTQFAKFAGEAVKRYSPQGIHTWEIWNEANMGSSNWKLGNIIGYTQLIKTTVPVMRTADANIVIISTGMGPAATDNGAISPLDFLDGLYQNGAKSYFDAVGDHPYSHPVPPSYYAEWNAWSQMSATSRSLRSIMNTNGDGGKQIWITEYGTPTGGPTVAAEASNYHLNLSPTHVTEELQSIILGDAFHLVKNYSWAGPMFWYSYIDQGTVNDTNENFFGILRADGSKKPAYNELKILTTQ